MLHDARKRTVPTIFVRYEDLCNTPDVEYTNIMKYIVGLDDISGTNAERRVKEVLAKGQKSTQTYDLKDSSKKFNSSMKYYTEAQVEYCKEELKEMLYFFGYVNSSLDKTENFTGFFEYDKATDLEMALLYNQHIRVTDSVIDWTATLTPQMLAEFAYQLSDKSKSVDILNWETSNDACKAINDWSERKLYGKSYTNCK